MEVVHPSGVVHAFRKLDESDQIVRAEIELSFRAAEPEAFVPVEFPAGVFLTVAAVFLARAIAVEPFGGIVRIQEPFPGHWTGRKSG